MAYTRRAAAEVAAEKTFNKLVIKNKRLVIRWGKAQGRQGASDGASTSQAAAAVAVPGLPGALPPPPEELTNNFFNLGGSSAAPAAAGAAPLLLPKLPGAIHYPSQDPGRMGSTHQH